jgi:hypothetical protein
LQAQLFCLTRFSDWGTLGQRVSDMEKNFSGIIITIAIIMGILGLAPILPGA